MVDGRLEPRQVGDEPRLAGEVLDLHAAVLFDERPRFFEAAQQLLLGLRRHRDVDVVDGAPMASTASSALPRKIRLVSEAKRFIAG